MGLLDDAIREHLELKRRHGADAAELARLERDAFGSPEEEHGEKGAYEDHEHHAGVATAEEEHEHHEAEAEPGYEAPAEPEQPTRQFTLEELEEAERHEAHHEPEERRAEEPTSPGPGSAEEGPAEHDELEETPEFLQETPEHDKLWFEQKPPKDFDF